MATLPRSGGVPSGPRLGRGQVRSDHGSRDDRTGRATDGTSALPLPARADAVVVGGGVVGTAVAHQLAEAGVRTVLVETAELAHGASGRNAGMVYQGAGPVDGRSTIPLTVLTNDLLAAYAREWGFAAFEYERCGDLNLVL